MRRFTFLLLLAALLAGRGKQRDLQRKDAAGKKQYVHVAKRAMYHWKNTYALSDEEREFMETHHIERLYVRFFDVTLEDLIDGYGPRAIPTATIQIERQWGKEFPEIVPTIFITPEAMQDIAKSGGNKEIAHKMLERIDHMRSFYDIPMHKVREIQLDCDWTTSTEQAFFDFCKAVRQQLPDNAFLSCTIRLHQLQRPEPPVDYGVLMLYNTNNLRNPSVRNSILSADDVKPYLKHVRYDLPLDLAYPAFAWDIWFHDDKFRGILRSTHQADSLRRAGEKVRHEEVDFDEIMKVKRLVEKRLPKPKNKRSTILYHLDKNNLKRYTHDEIESIYSR